MGFGFGSDAASLEFVVITDQAEAALDTLEKRFDDYEQTIEKIAGTFNRLLESNKKAAEFLEHGGRVGDVLAATKNNVDALTSAVDNQITRFEAARISNQAWMAGLELTDEQMASVLVTAKQFADATGTDLPSATERLTQAMIRGKERGLKPFGIEAGTLGEILEQTQKRMEGTSAAADDAGDQITRLKGAWTDFTDKIAVASAQSGPLQQGIRTIADIAVALASGSRAATAFGQAIGGVAAPVMSVVGALRQLNVEMQNQLTRDLAMAGAREGNQAQIGDGADTTGDGPSRAMSAVSVAQRFWSVADEAGGNRHGRSTGGGGGGGGRRQSAAFARIDAERERMRENVAQIARLDAMITENSLREQQQKTLHGQVQTEARIAQAQLEFSTRKRQLEQLMELEKTHARTVDEQIRSEQEAFKRREAMARQFSQVVVGGALSAIAAGVAQKKAGDQLLGEILIGFGKELLGAGIKESVTAAALAWTLNPAAGLHAGAAATYFAGAALFGVSGQALTAGGGGGRGGVAPSSAGVGRGLSSGGGSRGGGGDVINNYSIVIDTAGTGYVPEHVTREFHKMKALADHRHG